MYFVILATDRPGKAHIRSDFRKPHEDYLDSFGNQIVTAGATWSDDGSEMTGSFLLVDMADRAAVETFFNEDPFTIEGLYEPPEVRHWRMVYFNPPQD